MSVRSLNKVLLIGNLTRDPNLRYTPNGSAVASFSIATNRSWMPSDGGEKQEKAEFHNIVAWSKLAELCGQLLHKGDKVYVEGRLQTRDWQTKEGQDRQTTEIVIDNMILLTSRSGAAMGESNFTPNDEASTPAPTTKAPAKKSKKAAEPEETEVNRDEVSAVQDIADDVDIPF